MSTKVLVVDDEPDFVQLMAYNLTRAGFEVLQATNGLDAVHLARRHVPDVVLLDVMMPGFDGFSVCEVLGRSPVTARVPVILVTALDGAAAQARGIEAGAVKQLTKPVELQNLLTTVQEVVKRHRELFSSVEN
jgi:two-component system phosphate regulon response regulator PhoB